jgi:hypothetical protein
MTTRDISDANKRGSVRRQEKATARAAKNTAFLMKRFLL